MDILSAYSNKYAYILRQCKEISSCHITELNVQEPEFSRVLQHTFESLEYDINNLLPTLAPICDMYILLKVQCCTAFRCLKRIRKAHTKYLNMKKELKFTKEQCNMAFTTEALKPDPKIYHNDRVFSDVSHKLHQFNLQLYYMSMCGGITQPPSSSTSDLFYLHGVAVNINNIKCIEDYIEYLAIMCSYPVLQPNTSGLVLPSLNGIQLSAMNMQEAGPNSRSRMKTNSAVRVCLFCKIRNIMFGQTDHEEQSNRTICQCVAFNGHPSDSETFQMRASTLCRQMALQVKSHEAVQGAKIKMYNSYVTEFVTSLK